MNDDEYNLGESTYDSYFFKQQKEYAFKLFVFLFSLSDLFILFIKLIQKIGSCTL